MQHVILVRKELLRNYIILDRVTGDWATCMNLYLKINCTDFEKLSAPMEEFATVKQPRFFISESPESSDANIEQHYVSKIYEEHDRFNRAITTVADAALGLRWLPWSLFIHPRHCYNIIHWKCFRVV